MNTVLIQSLQFNTEALDTMFFIAYILLTFSRSNCSDIDWALCEYLQTLCKQNQRLALVRKSIFKIVQIWLDCLFFKFYWNKTQII